MYGAKSNDRELKNWLFKIENHEITLPRFQRGESWDAQRICSLMNSIIDGHPLGITLVLEVGDE